MAIQAQITTAAKQTVGTPGVMVNGISILLITGDATTGTVRVFAQNPQGSAYQEEAFTSVDLHRQPGRRRIILTPDSGVTYKVEAEGIDSATDIYLGP